METLITIDLLVSLGNLVMTMDFTSLYFLLQGYIIPLFRIKRFTFLLHIHFCFHWILFHFISSYRLNHYSVLGHLHQKMYFSSWALISICYPNFYLIFNSLLSFLLVILASPWSYVAYWNSLSFSLSLLLICVHVRVCHVMGTYFL